MHTETRSPYFDWRANMDMRQTTTEEAEMQKPENVTQAQWDHLMKHLESQPKIEVREEDTFERRNLVTEELLKTARPGGRKVYDWMSK